MEARKIIITGAATRMGAAIAKKLSGPNIEIVIHYNKSKSKAESLKKDLNKSGTKIYLVKADLTKENEIQKMLKFSKTKLKYFDCLINNASLFENDNLENFTTKSWESHLKANLKAPALLSKGFAKNAIAFLAKPFDNKAGAFKLAFKWLSQLFVVKFSRLSFSNNEALFIKQSKYFNFVFENFNIFCISFSLVKSAFTR